MQTARVRVLVVDDEPLIRWAVSEKLKGAGCDVVEAEDGRSALALLATCGEFDLVLLDHHLPDYDDLTLLGIVRCLVPLSEVIMMTAFITREVEERAIGLGAGRVLPKPFDLDELDSLVVRARRALRKRGQFHVTPPGERVM